MSDVAAFVEEHRLGATLQRAVSECFESGASQPLAYLAEWFTAASGLNVIDRIAAAEVLDARGVPTLQVVCFVNGRAAGTATAPSSCCSSFEAFEIRDGEPRYAGKGLRRIVAAVNDELNARLRGNAVIKVAQCDDVIRAADGTEQKARFGHHATSAASISVHLAAAALSARPPFAFLAEEYFGTLQYRMPTPVVTLIDGGRVGPGSRLRVQAVQLVLHAGPFPERLRQASAVYQALQKVCAAKCGQASLSVGERGGLTPPCESLGQALGFVEEACAACGCQLGEAASLAVACAGSDTYDAEAHRYDNYAADANPTKVTADELLQALQKVVAAHPHVRVVADPFDEDDTAAFARATAAFGAPPLPRAVWGGDVFGTSLPRLQQGIEQAWCSGAVVRLNQVGTVSEFVEVCRTLRSAPAWQCCVTTAGGDSASTFEADLAVACGAGFVDFGGLCRAEHTEKWNRLWAISEWLDRQQQ